jgi:NAD(P)-dependent dehydrogenase (short-subunit alcohol dehydrogenase family)
MHVTGRVVVVTGGAEGIGRGLVERFHEAGKPPRWQRGVTRRSVSSEPANASSLGRDQPKAASIHDFETR